MKKEICFFWSKDRAMQLHAALLSMKHFCQDFHKIRIIVSINSKESFYLDQYRKLKEIFPEIEFQLRTNLKEELSKAISQTSNFLMVEPDDVIFYRKFYFDEAFESLSENLDVVDFDFLHGKNTTYSDSHSRMINMPDFISVKTNVLKWNWENADAGFGWLVSSHVMFRKNDLSTFIKKVDFSCPLSFETNLVNERFNIFPEMPYKLCFQNSVSFTSPINSVQKYYNAKVHSEFDQSKETLAKMFDEGQRIDFLRCEKLDINDTHYPIKMEFLER